eukprot:3117844-Rhodomonas_salina.3
MAKRRTPRTNCCKAYRARALLRLISATPGALTWHRAWHRDALGCGTVSVTNQTLICLRVCGGCKHAE